MKFSGNYSNRVPLIGICVSSVMFMNKLTIVPVVEEFIAKEKFLNCPQLYSKYLLI